LLFFQCPPSSGALHSFPTRRSSDIVPAQRRRRLPSGLRRLAAAGRRLRLGRACATGELLRQSPRPAAAGPAAVQHLHPTEPAARSEEHTSELQSRENLECRLLLEKK